MRRIGSDEMKRIFDPVDDTFTREVGRTLSALPDRKEKPVMKKKISVGFVMAAVIVVLSLAAFAVTKLDVFRMMTDKHNPIVPLEEAADMVVTDLGRAENELGVLTVQEGAYDGKGVMLLLKLEAKNPETQALFNAMMQDAPENVYNVERVLAEVGEETTQVLNWDAGEITVVNKTGNQKVLVNGEEVAAPTTEEEALARGLPVYVSEGRMYYADQMDFRVNGRKDGKELIGYWAGMELVTPEDENAEMFIMSSMQTEEQPDGSILLWMDGFGEETLPETVTLRVHGAFSKEGKEEPIDTIEVTLARNTQETHLVLVPEEKISAEDVEIRSATIDFTPVRGYLTVEYTDANADERSMGLTFRLYDADGKEIHTGSGWTGEMQENGKTYFRMQTEMQSFRAIESPLTLEAKEIGGNVIGSWICRTEEQQ